MRVFAPGFGAGAVAGYTVMRIDPAVVAIADPAPAVGAVSPSEAAQPSTGQPPTERPSFGQSSEDVRLAFG